MSKLDDLIERIPKPALVIGVLIIALSIVIYTNPLKNGCEVQVSNFSENVKGFLINTKTKSKKMKFAEINMSKDFCKDGNSQGACDNYFSALDRIGKAFVTFNYECFEELSVDENFANLETQLKDAVKILALLAWGEKPPEGVADRAGWLSQTELYTFCRLKTALAEVIDEEAFSEFRISVFKEFPDAWPDQFKDQVSAEELRRPTAYKWIGNPQGTMTTEQIFERSIFSLRCDQFQ